MPDPSPEPDFAPRRRLRAGTFGRLKAGAARAHYQRLETLRAMRFPGYSGSGGGYGLGRRLSGSDYDYAGRAGDLADNSAVAACLRVLCDNFPQPRLQVERRSGQGQWEAAEGHPLARLFDRPNGYYDHFDLWSAVIMSLVVDGNAYLIKVRSGAGIPVELWWVPTWMVRPFWSAEPGQLIDWYAYQAGGEWIPLPPSEVVHFRHGRPDPTTCGRTHLSWLKSGLRSICGLNEADGYTASILRNGGVPGVVISPTPGTPTNGNTPGAFTKDQADKLKENWRQRFTGENRGDPLVMSGGSFAVTQVGFSPEQLALDKIPARMEDQICSLVGVNAMIALLTSGAQHKTYNNVKESRTGLYEDTIIPIQARTARKLDLQLLGDPGMGDPETERVAWDYEGIPCLQEDQQPVWDRTTAAYTAGYVKRSEAKQAVGLDYDAEDDVYATDVAAKASQDQMDAKAGHDAAMIDRQAEMGDAATGGGDEGDGQEGDGQQDDFEEVPEDDEPDDKAKPAKSLPADLLARAARLADSAPAPDPSDPAESTVIAKAVATLDAIMAQLGGNGGGEGQAETVADVAAQVDAVAETKAAIVGTPDDATDATAAIPPVDANTDGEPTDAA